MRFILVGSFAFSLAAAQTTTPLHPKRTAAAPSPTEINQAVSTLQGGQAMPPAAPPAPAAQADIAGSITAPSTFHPEREIPLDQKTQAALIRANTPAVPIATADGKVLYHYGEGMPAVVCEPGHLTTIELQPGETIAANPVPGDTSWDVLPFASEVNGQLFSTVSIRPKEENVETTLFVLTDRRPYYLRLLSRPRDYMPRIGFLYSQAETGWADYLAKVAEHRLLEAPKEPEKKAEPVAITITRGYHLETKKNFWGHHQAHPPWWPEDVSDNGAEVTITLPAAIQQTRMPAPMRGEGKHTEPLPYRVDGSKIIVKTLFEQGTLVAGVGKSQQAVLIRSPRGK